MLKQLTHILFIFLFALTVRAGDVVGDKESFLIQVGSFYRAQVSKLHEKNLQHLERKEYDSVKTSFTIDFTNWKYNSAKEKWETLAPDPVEVSSFPYSNNNFYYQYNIRDKSVTGEPDDTDAEGMAAHNNSQLAQHNTYSLLVYEIKTINMPLLYINKKFDNAAIDTTISLWDALQKTGYTDQEKYKSFLAMNNELGQKIFNDLEQFRLTSDMDYVLIYTSKSEYVPTNTSFANFRFFNIFSSYGVDDKLKETFSNTLSGFQFNGSVSSSDLTHSVVQILNCTLNNQCDNLFKTDEAKIFWMNFMTASENQGGDFFEKHKLKAIEIGAYIDNLQNREMAQKLKEKALCYVDDVLCPESEKINRTNVATAAHLTKRWFEENVLISFAHKLSFDGEISNDAITARFTDKFTDEQGVQGEVTFEFNSQQSKETMLELLRSFGLNEVSSYEFYLFATGKEDTWSAYGYWLDNWYFKTPPLFLNILSRFITGPASAVYGYFTGNDMFTGEELSGWDHVLNVIDFIPAVGAFWDVSTGLIKTIKFTTKTGVIRSIDAVNSASLKIYNAALKGINYTSKTCKNLVLRGMTWGLKPVYDVSVKALLWMDPSGKLLAKITGNELHIGKDALITTPGGQTFKIGDDADVYIDGQKQTGKYELVKDGEKVAFRGVGNINWLDELETVLGSGSKAKIQGWIEKGLDENKLKSAFSSSGDKADLFNKLETSKSVYHQRVYIADWDNIPGISKADYFPNGMTSGKTKPEWNNADFDLPSLEAANFVNATADELPAGTKIYRVTGGNPAGAYWTTQKPNSLSDVIGGTAVQPAWNSFEKMYVYQVPEGQTLKVWKGTAAKQPIAHNVSNPHLPGGAEQIFIPDILRNNVFKNQIQETSIPW